MTDQWGKANPYEPLTTNPNPAVAADPIREALDVLHADAKDPERAEMWRYGVRHTLTVVERALAATPAPEARAEQAKQQPDRDALAKELGWAVHELTTSITHKLATPTDLDRDCATFGRLFADRLLASGILATPSPAANSTADVLRDLMRDTAAHLDAHGCGCVWRVGVFEKERRALAATPPATPAPALDVERLARAMRASWWYRNDLDNLSKHAERVAREYAAFASTTPESREVES